MSTLRFSLLVFTWMWMGISGLIGWYDSYEGRYLGEFRKVGCQYRSLVDFAPGRVIVCELIRDRF